MDGLSVGDRLKNLKERMARAAERAGRKPSAVSLLAVSKKQPLYKIREAYQSGQNDFAENYVQEALVKMDQLRSLPVNWHFIGRIQSNKVRMLAGHFHSIHSVERENVAEALNRLSDRQPQRIFLQYNVAEETSKGGALEAELEQLFEDVLPRQQLRLMGLMVMPPLLEKPELVRPFFRRAKEKLDKLAEKIPSDLKSQHPFDELSMGTSADFEIAIEEGATWVRIGSELFGAREG